VRAQDSGAVRAAWLARGQAIPAAH
jgi:hypothetical protein